MSSSSASPIHKDILSNDKIDHAGTILAKESISQAPRGTHILQSGRDSSLPSFAVVRANLLQSVIPNFQRGVLTREAEKHARPFRLTDVPTERFANAIRVDNNEHGKRTKSGYDAVDEHGTQKRRKNVMYEDTNFLGVANLQIYAFFGLTAASGLGSVLILVSLKRVPQLLAALPFALFSGWQMYGYYLATKAAAEQATKVQYLRMVQGSIDGDDPDRLTKFVKKPEKLAVAAQQEEEEKSEEENNTFVGKDEAEKKQDVKKESVGEKQMKTQEAEFDKLKQSILIPTTRN
jgi:hypothetical protein